MPNTSPKPDRLVDPACLDPEARYAMDGQLLCRTLADGQTTRMAEVRLLLDLRAGVIAHGPPAEVDAVMARLLAAGRIAGAADPDDLIAFTLDAGETTALRVNKAVAQPAFAVLLARKVMQANGLPVPLPTPAARALRH